VQFYNLHSPKYYFLSEKKVFISYAQNLEDVMLSRVFAAKTDGFYVDVGAWDPDKDSVTKSFYEIGWSGINVEPGHHNWQRLVKTRTRDINLQVAVSDQEGQAKFLEVPGSGLSSLEAGVESTLDSYGLKGREKLVTLTTLAKIFEQHCQTQQVDFLKIDVEGHEDAVIKGMDWARFRPVVVLVEATIAETGEPNWAQWEGILLQSNYRFAWFDGLNRFYVRAENQELLAHFNKPPCVFDEFRLYRKHSLILAQSTAVRLALDRFLPHSVVDTLRKVYRRARRAVSR
jgi:FkbM family methyltransferase